MTNLDSILKRRDITLPTKSVQSKGKVTRSCLALCNPMGHTVHGILQARILEWVTVPFSRGSSQPRDQTQISHIAGRFLTSWATREALNKSSLNFLMLCLVIQSCPTLCDPMDCSLPGSSVHGVLQARILEWVAMPSSRGSSQPKDWTQVSCIKGRFFIIWATRESSSHVWMWELAHKEGWVLKNWCFWTVEKTLESPLDCKEIKPVNPKGNQSWILTGGIDTESEAPIFWPPDVKSRLTGKDLNAGKDWRQEEKGTTEDEMASLTQWTCVWASPGRWLWTGKPGMLQYMGSQRVRHDWMTEQNKKTSKDGGITYLISDYTTKLQSSRQYGPGTKTEV